MEERVCEVDGCTNLGRSRGQGKRRAPMCSTHSRERWPSLVEADRRYRTSGSQAARYAQRILDGERILHHRSHHRAMRLLLGGTVGDGLTVSRTCPEDCPSLYDGYDHHRGARVRSRLCSDPAHYCLESRAANLARKPR